MAASAAVNSSTGNGEGAVSRLPRRPARDLVHPYSQAPYQADPGKGEPYDSSCSWPYQVEPCHFVPGQSLPYQLTRFQRWTSQVERYQLEGTQGAPV